MNATSFNDRRTRELSFTVTMREGYHLQHLGLIPLWLFNSPAAIPFTQIVDHHYVDMWRPSESAKHKLDCATGVYDYPGDPPMAPHGMIHRPAAHEIIYAYNYEFFAVVSLDPETGQPTGEWSIARLD